MNINLLSFLVDVIPAAARKWVYAAYALAVIVAAVCSIVAVNIGATDQVLAYLGGLLGLVASANTVAPVNVSVPAPAPAPAPVQPPTTPPTA